MVGIIITDKMHPHKLFHRETLLVENAKCRGHLVRYLLSLPLLFMYFFTLPSLFMSTVYLVAFYTCIHIHVSCNMHGFWMLLCMLHMHVTWKITCMQHAYNVTCMDFGCFYACCMHVTWKITCTHISVVKICFPNVLN